VGHFINDLSVACWLNFLVFYLRRVVKTDVGPLVFLFGQVVDGVVTPLIGVLSDRIETPIGTLPPI
jgi:Na+/melibiose symporter-like transporter